VSETIIGVTILAIGNFEDNRYFGVFRFFTSIL